MSYTVFDIRSGKAHNARLDKYAEVVKALREIRGSEAPVWQAVCVAEEAGEFLKEFRRWMGHARRPQTKEVVELELADVIIASYCFAQMNDIDLDAAVDAKLAAIKERGGI